MKEEFIKLKKEELNYIDSIAEISSKKILTESEKIEIYRKMKKYKQQLNEVFLKLFKEISKEITPKNLHEAIIEFDIDKSFLSSLNIDSN